MLAINNAQKYALIHKLIYSNEIVSFYRKKNEIFQNVNPALDSASKSDKAWEWEKNWSLSLVKHINWNKIGVTSNLISLNLFYKFYPVQKKSRQREKMRKIWNGDHMAPFQLVWCKLEILSWNHF